MEEVKDVTQQYIEKGTVVISTSISRKDWLFCKQNGLKWSKLLEKAISVTRRLYESGNDPDIIKGYEMQIKRLKETNEKFNEFLEKNNLRDAWLNY